MPEALHQPDILPSKRYAGAIREKTTDRYFVDKFPLFFASESSVPPVVTFSFVDPGLLSLASFETHLLAYGQLFSVVPQLNFVYIATRPTHFETARDCVSQWRRAHEPRSRRRRFTLFPLSASLGNQQYGKLSADQIEFLNEATKRFTDARTEILYRPWRQGQITVGVVGEKFRKLAAKREVSFRTELVDGQAALFEARPRSWRENRK